MSQVASRRMTRRGLLKGAAVISGAVALGSALPAATSFAQPVPPPAGGKVNLKLLSWFWWEPGRRDAWRFVIDRFHQSQSDIRIEESGWNFDDYTNRIVVQLQSGRIDGDMIQTTPDLVLRLLKAGQLEPIESVVDAAGVKDLSSAHDFIRDANGHLYGLDMVSVAFGNLYNSALYAAAGIQDPAQTLDDWIDQVGRLTNRDAGQYGIYSPMLLSEAEAFWFRLQEWALPYDGTWAVGKTPMVTSAPIVNGLKLFKTMYDIGMPQGMDGATAVKAFSDGQIASQLAESAVVNVYKTNNPAVYADLRSVPPPWPSRKSLVRIHPLTVNAQSPNKDAAKQFLTFLYRQDNYRELLQRALDVIPAYPEGMSPEYVATLPWVSGYQAVNALSPTVLLGDFIYNNQEFGQIVITHFQDTLVNNVPVEEAMGAAQVELESLAQRLSA
jgi:ABC-type glycerol-3-phosphate transport system substrate-binding protein